MTGDVALDAPYRTFMSGFPSGVAVITTVDASGLPRGMTCTSLTSVTVRPPTLLVCVHMDSSTLAALTHRGMFAVNLLHAEGRPAAVVFASGDPNRFAGVRWRPSADYGLPLLTDAAGAVAQCAVSDVRRVGDHAVVFGEVRTVRSVGDRVPLLYGLRRYAAWPPERLPNEQRPPADDHPRGHGLGWAGSGRRHEETEAWKHCG